MFRTLLLAAIAALAIATPVAAQKVSTETLGGGSQLSFRTGYTSVKLDSGFLAAANSLGLRIRPVRPGYLRRNYATFPIIAGTVDVGSLRGEILHSGGLDLSAGDRTVTARNFIIDTSLASPALTAQVSVDGAVVGRIPLFNVDLTGASVRSYWRSVRVSNVGITLTDTAAGALNGVFGTSLPGGLVIGEATVFASTGFRWFDDDDD